MDNRCRTCKWYNADDYICTKAGWAPRYSDKVEGSDMVLFGFADDFGGFDVQFKPGPDFGCVLWEERKEE